MLQQLDTSLNTRSVQHLSLMCKIDPEFMLHIRHLSSFLCLLDVMIATSSLVLEETQKHRSLSECDFMQVDMQLSICTSCSVHL